MYLDSKDFQTVWRLAHNWVGADPDKSDPNALSTELKEAIHRLMSAAISRAITIRTRRMKFFMDETFLSIIFEFHHYKKFWKCLNGDEFNKAYLDSIYVKRGDVLRWCQNEFHEPPPVWRLADLEKQHQQEPATKTNAINRPKDEETDRQLCKAIAATLWSLDPNIHPTHMARSKVIQQYGQGRFYKDLNTIKKWIAEVDPLKDQRKSGRPPDIKYKTDLEMDSLLED